MKYFFCFLLLALNTNEKKSNLINIEYQDCFGEKITCIKSLNEKAVVLFLNGYNFSSEKAVKESNFISNASQRGYSVIIPEVRKTVYAQNNYPETANFLKTQKKLNYYADTIVSKFIKDNFKNKPLFIYGISTGARGTLLISIALQKKIRAIALLSGDYDQTINPGDNLMVAAFGPFAKNTKRWEEIENPFFELNQLSCFVYIYHSKTDKIVPFEHSKHLNAKLNQLNIENYFEAEINQNHEFEAWNLKTNQILDFFDEKFEK
jgi:predicted peptidase